MADPIALLGLKGVPLTRAAVQRAYARLLKETRPEDDPAAFQRLVEARDACLARVSAAPPPRPSSARDDVKPKDTVNPAPQADAAAMDHARPSPPRIAIVIDDPREGVPPRQSATVVGDGPKVAGSPVRIIIDDHDDEREAHFAAARQELAAATARHAADERAFEAWSASFRAKLGHHLMERTRPRDKAAWEALIAEVMSVAQPNRMVVERLIVSALVEYLQRVVPTHTLPQATRIAMPIQMLEAAFDWLADPSVINQTLGQQAPAFIVLLRCVVLRKSKSRRAAVLGPGYARLGFIEDADLAAVFAHSPRTLARLRAGVAAGRIALRFDLLGFLAPPLFAAWNLRSAGSVFMLAACIVASALIVVSQGEVVATHPERLIIIILALGWTNVWFGLMPDHVRLFWARKRANAASGQGVFDPEKRRLRLEPNAGPVGYTILILLGLLGAAIMLVFHLGAADIVMRAFNI